MRVLYAFPSTGFGHISRASELVPILQKNVDVDVLISGPNRTIKMPFDVQFHLEGLTFFASSRGGIDFWKTAKYNSLLRTYSEINSLKLSSYDLVISDFEPISAYAARKIKHPNCIELSHQSAVLHPKAPKPEKKDPIGKFILQHICPIENKKGFHFWSYDKSIFTPVIRKEIRRLTTSNRGHYCVYLPAYSPTYLYDILSQTPEVTWHIFSQQNVKFSKKSNCLFYPANNAVFLESFSSCEGILCGAGFETPAEALFLGKKLMVIPMKGQYEQQCNAAALRGLGIETASVLNLKSVSQLKHWISERTSLKMEYADMSEKIIESLIHPQSSILTSPELSSEIHRLAY